MCKIPKYRKTYSKDSSLPKHLPEALKIIQAQKQQIKDLELRKSQFDSIMENMTELVERSAPDYSLVYVNDAMAELYESTAEEMIGQNTIDLLVEADREDVMTLTNNVSVDNPTYKYEYRVQRKDGSILWIESTGCGFYDEDGNIIEYQDVGRDITHFKNMEEQLKRKIEKSTYEIQQTNNELMKVNTYLQSILKGISEGIAIIDSNGGCEFLNYGPNNIWKKPARDLGEYFSNLTFAKNNNIITKLLKHKQSFTDMEMHCQSRLGELDFVVSGVPFNNTKSESTMGILVLKPITQVHNMINRMSGAQSRFNFSDIVTNSMVLQDAIFLAKQGATSDCTILIEGESGTGKELFAQSIHSSSNRKNGPFVAVNCGAIPRELVASELFGYMEGAFTGAKKGGKPGKFELANGGTIFLDEIGDMPMEQQIALLRVLQERRVTRVGGEREIAIDVRIICATNRNLLNEVNEKNFREDLYYRLNVINFHIPPLRKRKEDILLLFSTFLSRSLPSEKILERIDPEVLEALVRYDWPGNVRELQNVAERMIYLSDGKEIAPQYLPQHILDYQGESPEPVYAPPIKTILRSENTESVLEIRKKNKLQKQALDREKLLAALNAANGNVTSAARSIGISRATFYRKMKNFEEDN
ncbi:MAG: sigma 54-interacting transcriptional regulator [Clostridiales bacterium]